MMTHNDANSAISIQYHTYLQMIKIDIDIPKLQYVEQLFMIFTIVFMMLYNTKTLSVYDFFRARYSTNKDIFLKGNIYTDRKYILRFVHIDNVYLNLCAFLQIQAIVFE